MNAQDSAIHLNKARWVCLVGAFGFVCIDVLTVHFVPSEPNFSLWRYLLAASFLSFFVFSFAFAWVRKHCVACLNILALFALTVWAFNLYLSLFSIHTVLAFWNMAIAGCALMQTHKRVLGYLGLVTLCFCVPLAFANVPMAEASILLLHFAAILVLCYVVFSLTIKRQEDVQRGQAILRTVVNELPDALWFGDSRGRLVVANSAGERLEQKILPVIRERAAELRKAATEPVRLEQAFEREDGTQYWGDVWVRRVEIGSEAQFLVRVSDVTERRQWEQQLVQAKLVAEEALETRSRFLANMSHEIRTPMNGVVAMSSLLLETELDLDQLESAQTIRTSAEALLCIINDILDFSKIDAGELELDLQIFKIEECVAEATELVASLSNEKSLELTYVIEPDVPTLCIGDMTRIRQILLNLLSNAIKFTEQGEIVVRIWQQAQDDQQEIHFSVEDSGIGIAKDKLSHLFDPFTQADNSTTRLYGGTGLGLAICRQLTNLMGGNVDVASEPGVGSTFHFFVCVGVAENQEERWPELVGKRLLLVDDNQTNLRILERTLVTQGAELVAYDQPAEALKDFPKHDFDAAILDFNMPGMDGLELASALRAQSDIPLMLLSSGTMKKTDNGLFAVRMNKPVRPSLLRDNLRAVLTGASDGHKPRTAQVQHDVNDPRLGQLRVLVAEDNTVNQLVIRKVLAKLGIDADIAANGREAVELNTRTPYDVILMDVQMPVMDGLAATSEIKRGADPLPHVIALTANAMDGDRDKCLKAGMDDYLSKPIKIDELRQRLLQRVSPVTDSLILG